MLILLCATRCVPPVPIRSTCLRSIHKYSLSVHGFICSCYIPMARTSFPSIQSPCSPRTTSTTLLPTRIIPNCRLAFWLTSLARSWKRWNPSRLTWVYPNLKVFPTITTMATKAAVVLTSCATAQSACSPFPLCWAICIS